MKEIEVLSQEEQKNVKGGMWVYIEKTDEWIWVEQKNAPQK